MDIVSSLPFKLQVIKRFPNLQVQEAVNFLSDDKELWTNNVVTLTIEENDEVEILFSSEDSNARLYIEALDIVSIDDRDIEIDENGQLYRRPNITPFVLYKSDNGYDALCVDTFKISVVCYEKWYYGTFQVLPKPLSLNEWKMMKEDLEEEIIGLAQDIVRRNIGIGNVQKGNVPPKALYNFIIIKKYAHKVITALMDIAENPRYEIVTQYEKVRNNREHSFDEKSVKRYVTKAGSEVTFLVPKKVINYDIQDNRLLKMIILDYENRLKQFLSLLEEMENYAETFLELGNRQYKAEWERSIREFKSMALKLRKLTSLLRTKEWYFQISDITVPYIPHSFVLDTRYNSLYQMYNELKKEEFQIDIDPEFSYTWKRSSYMYEMWCYFKICHMLALSYEMDIDNWESIFTGKILFPFLQKGTTVKFESQDLVLKLVYDKVLVTEKNKTSMENPLYIVKTHDYSRVHNRPDIVLHIYDKKNGWYLGALVFECKYRKIHSFWSHDLNRSSIGQLEAYYNNARSKYVFGEFGERLSIRPVKKVIVLTPDVHGEGIQETDFNIQVKSFKPQSFSGVSEALSEEVFGVLDELQKTSIELQNIH